MLVCYVECFYNRDGKWYYAGTYTALRLADLTTKEFEQLSNEVRLLSPRFLPFLLATHNHPRHLHT